jgi:hypothetical protein
MNGTTGPIGGLGQPCASAEEDIPAQRANANNATKQTYAFLLTIEYLSLHSSMSRARSLNDYFQQSIDQHAGSAPDIQVLLDVQEQPRRIRRVQSARLCRPVG